MKQLLQNLRDGKFDIVDCPAPARPPGFVLVANRASLISAGTERSTIRAAQASLIGKARQRPDKVRQVLDSIKKEGLLATWAKVQTKLDQPVALGYSSAGVVLDADPGETSARVGVRVACGGQGYASHAEIVVVPRNLVVPIPDGVSFEEASFATVGAIALQGVRRAQAELGHVVVVIGLGLIGQLTWQLLADAGCTVIGVDIETAAVERAKALGIHCALVGGRDDVERASLDATDGHGVDAVIVTASSQSNAPIELAGTICRERGKVVVVGAVPMDAPRDIYYRKELDLLISRSYGPGRYDPEYEEGGVDYPVGYVRWTEQRNMAAFLDAVARGGVKIPPLITHRFPLPEAENAYATLSLRGAEAPVGIVLTYPEGVEPVAQVPVTSKPVQAGPATLRVGFIGAGSFAQSYLLPHLRGQSGVELIAVATAEGYTAVHAAKKFGFNEAHSDGVKLATDPRVDAVFIATRHDQHVPLAKQALAAGKHVYVEKPLAVSPQHLAELLPVARTAGRVIQVGFNRRFSPLSVALKETLGVAKPVQVTYRVNAGPLPPEHWLMDPEQGGGRLVGEGCHFIDLIQFLTGAAPARVTATGFGGDAAGAWSLLIEMTDGSVGVLVYQANASPRVPKERVEAFAGGRGGIIHDWRSVDLFEGRRQRTVKASGQSKGFAEEIAAFLAAVRSGQPAISLESLALTTAATFAALESIAQRRPIDVALWS